MEAFGKFSSDGPTLFKLFWKSYHLKSGLAFIPRVLGHSGSEGMSTKRYQEVHFVSSAPGILGFILRVKARSLT